MSFVLLMPPGDCDKVSVSKLVKKGGGMRKNENGSVPKWCDDFGQFSQKEFISALIDGEVVQQDLVRLADHLSDRSDAKVCRQTVEQLIKCLLVRLQIYMLPFTERLAYIVMLKIPLEEVKQINTPDEEKQALSVLARCLNLPPALRPALDINHQSETLVQRITRSDKHLCQRILKRWYTAFMPWNLINTLMESQVAANEKPNFAELEELLSDFLRNMDCKIWVGHFKHYRHDCTAFHGMDEFIANHPWSIDRFVEAIDGGHVDLFVIMLAASVDTHQQLSAKDITVIVNKLKSRGMQASGTCYAYILKPLFCCSSLPLGDVQWTERMNDIREIFQRMATNYNAKTCLVDKDGSKGEAPVSAIELTMV